MVVPDHDRAQEWQARLTMCGVPAGEIRVLPSGIASVFDDAGPERFALSDRAGALLKLASDESCLIITTPQAALERCLNADRFLADTLSLRAGDQMSADRIVQHLNHAAYEREDPVRRPGGYVVRGGIIDVFPAGDELPTRIELFGDEVDSLRKFDPESQRSLVETNVVRMPPLRSVEPEPLSSLKTDRLRERLQTRLAELDGEAAENLRENIERDIRQLEKGGLFNRLELYSDQFEGRDACAVDYLRDACLVLIEPFELEVAASRSREDLRESLIHRADAGEILPTDVDVFAAEFSKFHEAEFSICTTTFDDPPQGFDYEAEIALETKSTASYKGNAAALAKAIQTWKNNDVAIWIATDQPTRASQVLKQVGISAALPQDDHPPADAKAVLIKGNLAGGFLCESSRYVLLTDAELFGGGRLRLPQRRFNEGASIASVLDLRPGDYVVHIQFGIGKYCGLVKRDVDGQPKEFLQIEYAPPDKLLVPTDQLDRIQKYLSPSDAQPQLHRITGSDWARALRNAKKGAEDLARDLIRIYAHRAAASRPPFDEDSPWQTEMEAAFQWIETPSQLAAVEDIKRDLAEPHPMDRLVCGDVGFGKTEVAVRTAFKVAQAGMQVAVLCPTTILAEQHYQTFKERLAPYPIELRQLSRLRSSKERLETLEGLRDGKVNIVIGTHALLQKSVAFARLGLLIVDEEQRFGVKHKEKLKEMRASADCLTITATPIPRTLSMALMNIRPMSLINDPPPGRLPIRTIVRTFSDHIVREALLKELSRAGQALYVFNRVQGIHHTAERVRKLVPNARIGVAHGQMSPHELEPVMEAFYHREIDVLVCTTIVENGIDNPNVNTMIVDGADKMGLAQLYQLRGRVGRSDRQAYAYFLYQQGKELTEGAIERLKALQEFSELGSGYSLAFRDLQIRGAGELLGAKQHGLMHTVGYELYVQLINQAVQQLKAATDYGGEAAARLTKVDLSAATDLHELPPFELPVGAYIPMDYVRDENQRLFYYKKLMEARAYSEVDAIVDELRDRYGPLPKAAELAGQLVRVRIRAKELGVKRVDAKRDVIAIQFEKHHELPLKIVHALQRENRSLRFRPDRIECKFAGDALTAVSEALDRIQNETKTSPKQPAART